MQSGTLDALRVGAIHIKYKYIALILLMLQTTAVVLALRYSRTHVENSRYISTTAVVMSEFFKIVGSLVLLLYEQRKHLSSMAEFLRHEPIDGMRDQLKLGVPGLLYTLQNNLLFIALSNLPAATYQVTYQLKILTAAVFSILLLGRSLNLYQWISLFLLMSGVAFVQMPASDSGVTKHDGNTIVGLMAVLLACCSSGFAGVYFEKILKNTKSSLWMRNIQLGVYGVVLGLVGVLTNDWKKVSENGFFFGYNGVTWLVIILQGLGGLIIAAVIKYADNILKSFATSLSILVTAIMAYVLLDDFTFSINFFIGSVLVISATFLYGWEMPKKNKSITLPGPSK